MTTPPGYDMSIHSNPDARAWARFFSETFPAGALVPDEATMLGWFANAMMAMHDHLKRVPASPEAPAPAPFLLREFAALVDALEEAAASEGLAPNAGTAQKTDAARFALLSAISRAVSEARRGCEVCRAASASTAKTVPQGYAAGWHDAVRALASTTSRAALSAPAPDACKRCRGTGLGKYAVDEGAGSDTCVACKGTGGAPAPGDATATKTPEDRRDD